MSQIEVFRFPATGQQVRTVLIDGEPWWVVNDVCGVLEIRDARQAAERIDEDDRCLAPVTDSLGRSQSTWVVNESGLYELIIRSDKPQAKAFRRWVTGEVLPAIRKTGGYGQPRELSRLQLIELARDAELSRIEAEKRLEIAAPKVTAYDELMSSDGLIDMTSIANTLGLSVVRMTTWLVAIGVFRKQVSVENGRNLPRQEWQPDFFQVKQETNGYAVYPVVYATGAGFELIANRWREQQGGAA